MKNAQSIILWFALTLLLGSCSKDAKIDTILNDDRDVRIKRVSYLYDYGTGIPEEVNYTYLYASDGQIDKIVYTNDKSTTRASFEQKSDGLHAISEFGTNDFNWQKSIISSTEGKVNSIWVLNNNLTWGFLKNPGIMVFNRQANGILSKVELKRDVGNEGDPSFFPLQTEIESYFLDNLPQSIRSLPNLTFLDNGWGIDKLLFDFEFFYVEAEDVPLKLKRMVNEELLHLNKYGVTGFDVKSIGITPGINYSTFGEGNWFISFALWDKHILSESSTHLVSKRVTKHYIKDDTGTTVYQKTTVEDFPYTHDPVAKTLEIAGLKIWYEVVE